MSVNPDVRSSQRAAPPARPTPSTNQRLAFRLDRFATLCDALDYAAQGETGMNFFNLRGELSESVSYAQLQAEATALA
ncbi:MAG: hypothetical protein AAGC56_04900, partial [Pseudomonadota bacterium]